MKRMRAKRAPRSPIMSCSIIPFFKEPRFTKSNEPLPRVGDVLVLAMTQGKAVFTDPRKDSRAPKVLVCGPRFSVEG